MEKNWEQYAKSTVPRLCLPDSQTEFDRELKHDWQSVGAQAVNHVVNKLMLALFAPSRPFMRIRIDPEALDAAENEQEGSRNDLENYTAYLEKESLQALEGMHGARSKLHTTIMNLVVLGNALLYLPPTDKEEMRCYYVKDWVVRRTATGVIRELLTKEKFLFDELDARIQQEFSDKGYKPEDEVALYKHILRTDTGGYTLEVSIDKHKVQNKAFHGSYKDSSDLPYKVLTWQLKDNDHYGTGLVEDYIGDLYAISEMSEATITGALQACKFLWLVRPGTVTRAADLTDAENGAFVPGSPDDIQALTVTGKSNDLAVIKATQEEYIRRVGHGFLLNSAVTRNAERVTAEEIRIQASELETSLGGAYSRIATDLQLPLAEWLMKKLGELKIDGKIVTMTIVTGLDALSRSGDLDALRASLADISGLNNLGPELLGVLDVSSIISTIFIGHGVNGGLYVKSQEQLAAEQEAQQQQEAIAQDEAQLQ